MGFRRADLQPAFEVPGDHGFRVWGYGTTDTLDEILRPRYLRGGRARFALGDLIWVRTRPRYDPTTRAEVGETRAALVMVSSWHISGDATLRLVQDFGPPDDGHGAAPAPAAKDPPAPAAEAPPAPEAAPEPAPKRKRGRPPKPRTLTRL